MFELEHGVERRDLGTARPVYRHHRSPARELRLDQTFLGEIDECDPEPVACRGLAIANGSAREVLAKLGARREQVRQGGVQRRGLQLAAGVKKPRIERRELRHWPVRGPGARRHLTLHGLRHVNELRQTRW